MDALLPIVKLLIDAAGPIGAAIALAVSLVLMGRKAKTESADEQRATSSGTEQAEHQTIVMQIHYTEERMMAATRGIDHQIREIKEILEEIQDKLRSRP